MARRDAPPPAVAGDADIARIGGLLAEPARCAILISLVDGRALPAGELATRAGVSPATASSHLRKLTDADMLTVEVHGRHRYYRLAGAHVAALLESLQQLAPRAPIRSLRQSTRSEALRAARTCYDHLAGRLGVRLMATLIERGWLDGGDGLFDPARATSDRLSAPGHDVDYRVTASGSTFLDSFGVQVPPRRKLVRYCVDWSEQQHHLAGALGCGLLDRVEELGWTRRDANSRAIKVTPAGRRGFAHTFGIDAA